MSEEKLCPFRTDVILQRNESGMELGSFTEFLPCLKEKCTMWRVGETGKMVGTGKIGYPIRPQDEAHEIMVPETVGYCGLAGKP